MFGFLFESEDERIDGLVTLDLNHLKAWEVFFDKALKTFFNRIIGILTIEDGEDGFLFDFRNLMKEFLDGVHHIRGRRDDVVHEDAHVIAFFDGNAVIQGVTDGWGNLSGDDSSHGIVHGFDALIDILAIEARHGESAIGLDDALGMKDVDLALSIELSGLLSGKDDVAVIWEDDDVVRISGIEGSDEVIGAWVHGLTTADDLVGTHIEEEFGDAVRWGDGNDLDRLTLLVDHDMLGWFLLFDWHLFEKLLVMLNGHVLHLKSDEFAELLSILDGFPWLFGVDVDFDDGLLFESDD